MSNLTDIELEESLLSSLVEYPDWFKVVVDHAKLDEHAFSTSETILVFGALVALTKKGISPNAQLVYRELGVSDFDENDYNYIESEDVELLQSVDVAISYAKTLVDLSIKRALVSSLNRAQSEIRSNLNKDPKELCALVQNQISSTSMLITSSNNGEVTGADLVDPLLDSILKNAESEDGVVGLHTGLDSLDRLTRGFQKAKYIIVAGRPAMGKTTFAMGACLAALRKNKNVRIYSLEMPALDLMRRLIANIAGIEMDNLKTGRLTESEASRFLSATQQVRDFGSRLTIVEGGKSATEIRSDCLLAHSKADIDLVMLDYFQLIHTRGLTAKGDVEKYSEMSRILNDLKGEINAPIVLLSQLSRNLEQRMDKRPIQSDLRGTGQLEQDADIILMCYRDEVYNPLTPLKNVFEVGIPKNRDGMTGIALGKFVGGFNRIESITVDSEEKLRVIIDGSAIRPSKKLKRIAHDSETEDVLESTTALAMDIVQSQRLSVDRVAPEMASVEHLERVADILRDNQ